MSVLGADADWIEGFRRTWYPRLHPHLVSFGGRIGTPMYAVGTVRWNQFVGELSEDEEAIEEALDERGRRNPIACLKELPDGRVSEGSWVVLHGDAPPLIEEGMQLHFTLFALQDDSRGRELYAHYEDDWRSSWREHLTETNFSASEGVTLAKEYLDEHTHLVLQ